jgi:hypothetical protein
MVCEGLAGLRLPASGEAILLARKYGAIYIPVSTQEM